MIGQLFRGMHLQGKQEAHCAVRSGCPSENVWPFVSSSDYPLWLWLEKEGGGQKEMVDWYFYYPPNYYLPPYNSSSSYRCTEACCDWLPKSEHAALLRCERRASKAPLL